jgi:hypothetical protein
MLAQPMQSPSTYADALDLLNARRAGLDMPERWILRALELTGDYVPQSRYMPPPAVPFVRLFEVRQ